MFGVGGRRKERKYPLCVLGEIENSFQVERYHCQLLCPLAITANVNLTDHIVIFLNSYDNIVYLFVPLLYTEGMSLYAQTKLMSLNVK